LVTGYRKTHNGERDNVGDKVGPFEINNGKEEDGEGKEKNSLIPAKFTGVDIVDFAVIEAK